LRRPRRGASSYAQQRLSVARKAIAVMAIKANKKAGPTLGSGSDLRYGLKAGNPKATTAIVMQQPALSTPSLNRRLVGSRGAVSSGRCAHFQQESNWSSISSPHLGQFHMRCLCALTMIIQSACTAPCTPDFHNALRYHDLMTYDLLISVKDYRGGKNLKIQLAQLGFCVWWVESF
jgi:hypothetical protein